MAALRIPREIRDAVQNHKPQGIGDRAYNFHDYADEKREALQRWADHVREDREVQPGHSRLKSPASSLGRNAGFFARRNRKILFVYRDVRAKKR